MSGSPPSISFASSWPLPTRAASTRPARKLGRALSVVSYGISTLEAQLGVLLFEREGSRRPQLTEAGRALLPDARAMADVADGLVATRTDDQAGAGDDSRAGSRRDGAERSGGRGAAGVSGGVSHRRPAPPCRGARRRRGAGAGQGCRSGDRRAGHSRPAGTRATGGRQRRTGAGGGARPSARTARDDRARAKRGSICSWC